MLACVWAVWFRVIVGVLRSVGGAPQGTFSLSITKGGWDGQKNKSKAFLCAAKWRRGGFFCSSRSTTLHGWFKDRIVQFIMWNVLLFESNKNSFNKDKDKDKDIGDWDSSKEMQLFLRNLIFYAPESTLKKELLGLHSRKQLKSLKPSCLFLLPTHLSYQWVTGFFYCATPRFILNSAVGHVLYFEPMRKGSKLNLVGVEPVWHARSCANPVGSLGLVIYSWPF